VNDRRLGGSNKVDTVYISRSSHISLSSRKVGGSFFDTYNSVLIMYVRLGRSQYADIRLLLSEHIQCILASSVKVSPTRTSSVCLNSYTVNCYQTAQIDRNDSNSDVLINYYPLVSGHRPGAFESDTMVFGRTGHNDTMYPSLAG
jgi:hypothetical protein